MAERSGAIENQARDGASERSESSVGEEIEAPGSTWWLNGGRWSERGRAIRSGFTMEKGFRGQHFEHISGFEGEQEILGGNQGYFPDFCRKLRRKVHFIPDSGE